VYIVSHFNGVLCWIMLGAILKLQELNEIMCKLMRFSWWSYYYL